MLSDWTHGAAGLWTAFATVQAPMLVALARAKAPLRQYLSAPLVAAPLTVVAGVGMAALSPALQSLGIAAQGGLQWTIGTAAAAGLGFLAGRVLAQERGGLTGLQRGSMVEHDGAVPREPLPHERHRSASRGRERPLTLAGIPVPTQDEAKHFKLIGTTGTGKSTGVRELLQGALTRGDRAVIADPDGGYLRRFYSAERGDRILNPFDSRSDKWDLFGEIENSYDVEQLARSLIPDHEGADRSWRAYARTFFTAVTRQAQEAGIRDPRDLYRLLVVARPDELRTLVEGTPAQPFLDEHNARMFDSIRSVTSAAVAALEHVGEQDAPPLSIRRWVAEDRPGVLFMPYKAGQIAALRTSISAWMRLAIFETMNREEPLSNDHDQSAAGTNKRLWFVVDELDALGQVDGLKDALARLRKFDGRVILGFQSIAQVSSTYGHGEAHTLVENCSNTLILRSSASEGGGTARFASQLVGDREVLRSSVSTTRRFGEWVGSKTESLNLAVEPALLPSQIEQLPDLSGFLKFASDPVWRRVRLVPEAVPPLRPTARKLGPHIGAIRGADREPGGLEL